MRAVITGGSGFLGSHLAELLLKKNHQPVCLSRGRTDTSYLKSLGLTPVKADVMDRGSIEKNIGPGDLIFHTAAILGSAKADPKDYMAFNVQGTVNVLEAAIRSGAGKFIFVSTTAAMGPVGFPEAPMTEKTPCRPDSAYGKSKLKAEKKIHELAQSKIPCLIVRPHIIYGPRSNPISSTARLFSAMQKKTALIIGNTKNYFPLCYVKNLAAAMVYLAQKQDHGIHTYLVGDQEILSLGEVMELIGREFGINKRIVHIPYWLPYSIAAAADLAGRLFHFTPLLSRDVVRGMAKSLYLYDLSKTKGAGFEPPFTLEEGIKETARWIKIRSAC